MGSDNKKTRRKKAPRAKRLAPADFRVRLMEQLGTATATEMWTKSSNPIKARIGRLEVAWREGIQWLAEDIQKMFQNFAVISDAYDDQDINTAALKKTLIEAGVITEDAYQENRVFFRKVFDTEMERRQAELEKLQAEAEGRDLEEEARTEEAEKGAGDGSRVTPELKAMRKNARDATGYVPPEAFEYSGS